jgi:hypothetical protein
VSIVVETVVAVVSIRPVSALRSIKVLARQPLLFSGHYQQSDFQRFRGLTLLMSSICFFSPYPSIFSPLNRPLIYCGRAGSPGACPQTCRPDIALVRAARLPGPTRRALSGILAVTRNRVRTRAIGPLVRTPLVIGNVRFTRFLYVNFGAHAPSTVAEIVDKLTVPTVGMSVCELFYRKASRPLSSVRVCLRPRKHNQNNTSNTRVNVTSRGGRVPLQYHCDIRTKLTVQQFRSKIDMNVTTAKQLIFIFAQPQISLKGSKTVRIL